MTSSALSTSTEEEKCEILLEDLSLLLKQEQSLHQRLLECLEGESKAFGTASGTEMWHIQVNKDQCVHKIQRLEEQRIEVTEKLASLWDTSIEELTLRVIIERIKPDLGVSLQQCFAGLKSLLADIKSISEENATLSSSRLKSIEQSMRFINEYNTERTYSDSGTLRNTTKVLRTSV